MNFADKLFSTLDEARNRRGGKLGIDDWKRIVQETYDAFKKAAKKAKVPLSRMSRDELIATFAADPSLAELNIEAEFCACERWCRLRGLKASPRRYLNWINKAATDHALRQPAGTRKPKQYDGPEGWVAVAKDLYPGATIDFAAAGSWPLLPESVQTAILEKCGQE